MNVTELARKVRINTADLLDILPLFGFDIGKRAIKVDDKIAGQIIREWPRIKKELDFQQRKKDQAQKDKDKELRAQIKREIFIPPTVSVKDFAQLIEIPVSDVMKALMGSGIMATLNEKIDFDTASIIADEFGVTVLLHSDAEVEEAKDERLKAHIEGDKNNIKRPPVIVIMGHVNHGKTKLLDTIREANVVDDESGGITQHIGAYQVVHNDKKITFIDTPGHEAFTAMRSRGAKVADIAILVVAADDSIKPQTKEAIKIIKQSGIPMIVAINKIDKPGADVEKVKQDLAQENLTPEDWGGNTMIQEISAKENINIDKLLDLILLVDEMEQDKIVANPNKEAAGTIIEAHVDKGQGPVTTALVQSGTLRVGDQIMINDVFYGKVRKLENFLGVGVESATPSTPVKILGLKFSPKVGDIIEVVGGKIFRASKKVTAHDINKEDSVVQKMSSGQEDSQDDAIEQQNVIIKADTLGSLEVIIESLEKLSTDKVRVKILHKGLGNITDTDIIRASDEGAMVVGFHVKPLPGAEKLANERDIKVDLYEVIYNLIDDVKAQMLSLVKPEMVKKLLGKMEILAIFKSEKKTMILGGKVIEGKIVNKSKADVLRGGSLYETGEIINLQSGKEDVNDVVEGNECGISYKGSSDVEVGDIIESYIEEEKK